MGDHAEVPVPVVLDGEKGDLQMDVNDVAMLKVHAHNGGQAQADAGRLYADDARRDYLLQRGKMDMAQAWGARYITCPHPQFGTPDKA
jgi:hypothetical protein